MRTCPVFPIRLQPFSRWSRLVWLPVWVGFLLGTADAQTHVLDVSGGATVYASAPHQEYLSAMSNMTAETWINTTESTGPRFFIAKYTSSSRLTGGEWYMGLESGGSSVRVMVVPAGEGGNGAHRVFSLPTGVVYNDGRWHHFAFTYDETKIEAFHNGISLGVNTSTTGPIRTNTVAVNVGVINNGNSPASDANSYIGLIGETRLWNTIRSAQEIRDSMHRRLRGDESGLVGYWPLNEGSGTAILDRSTHANTGTVHGAVWTPTDLPVGFILANRATGSLLYTHDTTVDVAEFSIHADYTHFQITENGAPPNGTWQILDAAPSTLSFSAPPSGTEVSFTAWYTNTNDSALMLSDSSTLIYTTTALPQAVAVATLVRDILPTRNATVVITGEELDDGSSGGTYNGTPLEIHALRAICADGLHDATPEAPFMTLTAPGTYDVRLVVMNETGNVATSDVCTVTVTMTPARFVSNHGDDGNDGTSWSEAWATPEHAVTVSPAGVTIVLSNGVYNLTETLVLDKALTVVSYTETAEDVIFEPAASRINLVELSHADAAVKFVTLQNGSTGARLLEGGTVYGGIIRGCNNSGVFLLNGGLVSNSVITNNSASSGGGAILDGGGTVVRNCLIAENQASSGLGWGGGIFFIRGSIANEALAENCTIVNNFALQRGGGLRVNGNDQGTLRNCIVYGNRSLNIERVVEDEASGNVRVFDTILAPARTRGGTSIDANPQFMDAANGDFRLRPGSSAINAGAMRDWMDVVALDLGGRPRVDGILPDMGAYEYQTISLDCGFEPESRVGFLPDATITFTATVLGENTDGLIYAWDFDGSGTPDLVGAAHDAPTHVYTEPGLYTVTLTVSNDLDEQATYVFEDAVHIGFVTTYVARGLNTDIFPYDSWDNAASNLQAAVDAAVPGSTIRVGAGTYPLDATVEVRKGIRIEGAADASLVIFDGQEAVMCLHIEHPDAVVDGLTLARGYGSPAGGATIYWGGTLQNSLVRDGSTPAGGNVGGVAVEGGSGLVSHCILHGNRGGGAHHAAGGARLLYGAILRNSLVYGNVSGGSSTATSAGGVVVIRNAIVESCTVVGNDGYGTHDMATGGVHSQQGIRGTLFNSIVYFNRGAGDSHDVANGFTSASANNIVGSTAWVDVIGSNVSTADPNFRQKGNGYGESHVPGNYRLRLDSPAVGTGLFRDWMTDALDLGGDPRIVEDVDIGAYELQPQAGTLLILL